MELLNIGLVLGIGLASFFFTVLSCAIICFYFNRRLLLVETLNDEHSAVILEFEELLKKYEEEGIRRLSEQGKKGVEIREENKEMRLAAMQEGRAVISGPGSLEDKKNGIFKLIQKYPLVAEGVARSLNREYGISKMLGMPEDALLQQVAQIAAKALAQPEQVATWKD